MKAAIGARGFSRAIASALVMAAVSTTGDYLWKNVLPHHIPIYGLAHGTLLFLTAGLCLGVAAGKPALGAIGGAVIGFSAAGSFYLLQPLMGYSAMFVLFIALWVALGLLNGRVLQQRESMRVVLIRSAIAAVGTGLGFYVISGIWFPFNPRGWDYLRHFVSWTVAYLPAFAALLSQRTPQ